MDEPLKTLKKSPIVEAVLDIECDLPPGLPLVSLEASARTILQDHYTKFRKQILHEQNFASNTTEANKITLKLQGSIQGLLFLHEDEKQIVQFRAQGFSFNRLAPYGSLDDYLSEIERTWRLYIGLASPIQVRAIRLRYINRLPLPTVKGVVELNDYLKAGPRLPDEKKLALGGFLNQYTAVEIGTQNVVNVVLTAQEPTGGEFPVIFDVSAGVTSNMDPTNWTLILAKIQELRKLKNNVFKDTLTETCLNLFLQP